MIFLHTYINVYRWSFLALDFFLRPCTMAFSLRSRSWGVTRRDTPTMHGGCTGRGGHCLGRQSSHFLPSGSVVNPISLQGVDRHGGATAARKRMKRKTGRKKKIMKRWIRTWRASNNKHGPSGTADPSACRPSAVLYFQRTGGNSLE